MKRVYRRNQSLAKLNPESRFQPQYQPESGCSMLDKHEIHKTRRQLLVRTRVASPEDGVARDRNHGSAGLGSWVLKVLLVLALVVLRSFGDNARTIAKRQSLTAAARAPVTLMDQTEHLPAPSWKAIPLRLPHSGSISVDVRVVQGNPIDVLLITPDQLDRVKKGESSRLKISGQVRGTDTKSYTHTGRLARGGYFLVLGDRYLGGPSLTSVVTVKVQLNP
jgi:hypothetical protein